MNDMDRRPPTPSPTRAPAWAATLALLALVPPAPGAAPASDLPPPAPAPLRAFPHDCGLVDVKARYGARGDGVTDDTAALRRAIGENVGNTNNPRTLYFPAGRYLVSNTLEWRLTEPATRSNRGYRPYLVLQGQGRGRSVIVLKDACPGFTDPAKPKPVILTASSDQGDAWATPGIGNEAFQNSLYDLTVDTGKGNAGAVGIDYLASNKGCLRGVEVRSGDGSGVCGVRMERPWPGPCLLKDVTVAGFDWAVRVGQADYGVTMEDVSFRGQRVGGVFVDKNVIAARRVASDRPVASGSASALVVLVDSPGVTTEGPGKVVREGGLGLPVRDTPRYEDDDPDHWAVVRPRSPADDPGDDEEDADAPATDDTAAIQAAMDSGKPVVCLAAGRYTVSGTIRVPASVRIVRGFDSSLDLSADFDTPAAAKAVFRIEGAAAEPLILERLNAQSGRKGAGAIWVEHASPRDVAVVDCYFGVGTKYRAAAGPGGRPGKCGDLFLENVYSLDGPWRFSPGQRVWARQFDPEAMKRREEDPPADLKTPRVRNDGADLWVLGLKSEGPGLLLETAGGGRTEILGGLMHCNVPRPADLPLVVLRGDDAAAALYMASSVHKLENRMELLVRRHAADGTVADTRRADVAGRGWGSVLTFSTKDEPKAAGPKVEGSN